VSSFYGNLNSATANPVTFTPKCWADPYNFSITATAQADASKTAAAALMMYGAVAPTWAAIRSNQTTMFYSTYGVSSVTRNPALGTVTYVTGSPGIQYKAPSVSSRKIVTLTIYTTAGKTQQAEVTIDP
jgi:hypothetical protein